MEIKKFHLVDLSKKDDIKPQVTPEPLCDEENNLSKESEEEVSQEEIFAETNSLAEIGYEEKPTPIDKKIYLTEEELNDLILKAKEEARAEFLIQDQIIKETKTAAEENFATELTLLKEKITVELYGLLDKIIELSRAIANKLIERFNGDHLMEAIKAKIKDLGFTESLKLEVPTEKLAEKLSDLGIEISVNNAMLYGDYKVIWCNGFLEKNTAEITGAIEEIILENKKIN